MICKSSLNKRAAGVDLRTSSLTQLQRKLRTPGLLLLAALALAVAACGPEQYVEPSLKGAGELKSAELHSKNGRAAVRVPFKARGEGIGTEAPAEPSCDAGFFPTGNMAHGNGTHLGRFTSIHRQCVNFETLEFRNGTVTFHAANGDQLHATFAGFLSPTSEPGVLSFDNPAYGAGGTGRFAGAEGVFRAYGLVNVNDNTFQISVEGFLLLPR